MSSPPRPSSSRPDTSLPIIPELQIIANPTRFDAIVAQAERRAQATFARVDAKVKAMMADPKNQKTHKDRLGHSRSKGHDTSTSVSSTDATIVQNVQGGRSEWIYGEYANDDGVLQFCEKRVISPYIIVLGIMGLKPFQGSSQGLTRFSRNLNKLYIISVILLLLAGYVLQYLTCFRRDRGFSYREELSVMKPKSLTDFDLGNKDYHLTNGYNRNLTVFERTFEERTTLPEPESHHSRKQHNICQGNVFFVHGVPSFLHFTSFMFMIYLYWLRQDEQLQNLVNRTFLLAAKPFTTIKSQKKVIKGMRYLAVIGCVWITASFSCLIYLIFYHRLIVNFWPSAGLEAIWVLAGAMFFSCLLQDGIQVTMIINYCIHCHILSRYLQFLYNAISHHVMALQDCVKEMGEIDRLLKFINSDLATGLLPLMLLDTMLLIGSISHLVKNWNVFLLKQLICSFFICVLWAVLLALPCIMAAKLSSSLKRVLKLGHLVRMRPFGFQNESQADSDSFLVFLATINMEVRILGISLSAAKLYITVCFTTFLLCLWGYFQ